MRNAISTFEHCRLNGVARKKTKKQTYIQKTYCLISFIFCGKHKSFITNFEIDEIGHLTVMPVFPS